MKIDRNRELPDDAEVRRAIGGDIEAYGRLVMRMERTLYRVSYTILRCDHDCEDAVQTALETAFRSLRKVKHPAYFQSWLIRILINVCYDIGRHNQRAAKRLVPWEDACEPEMNREDVELRMALDALPDSLRLPIVLHYLEGYGVDEISSILHIPAGTVKSRLSRARQALRGWLEAEEEVGYERIRPEARPYI